eukprot:TRINITY_DN33360_c0_g1_i1.p2 TRINITY_DN33360_c0_g1~~TRINITY_DN33360_c0_g1_i1.p2  ORF type:complete len:120 (-),score=46.41 TRINITY_DN33360_c0_g1_i1:135-494(-)
MEEDALMSRAALKLAEEVTARFAAESRADEAVRRQSKTAGQLASEIAAKGAARDAAEDFARLAEFALDARAGSEGELGTTAELMRTANKLAMQRVVEAQEIVMRAKDCLLYTSPSPRDS